MKQLRVAGAVALVAGSLTLQAQVGAQATREAEKQFRAAQYKQEAQGDLKGAIEEYKKVAQGPDRTLAARALLAMGETYQMLGAPDARGVFAQIVREFTEPKEVVATARVRLAALTPASRQSDPQAPRLVMTGKADAISADGLSIAYVENGDLLVRDIPTGQVNRVVAATRVKQSALGAYAAPAFSADGRQIAYLWRDESTPPVQSLRIISREAAAQPRVLMEGQPMGMVNPIGWSPDGKSVLVLRVRPAPGSKPFIASALLSELTWVSVADGREKSLKTFESGRAPTGARLSPDGRSVAYSTRTNTMPLAAVDSPLSRILVLQEDGTETEVVRLAGNHYSPIWTPDGSRLIYVSDRSGAMALWSVGIRGGQATDEPAILKVKYDRARPLGVTPTGSLYYATSSGGDTRVFVAERDATGGPAGQVPPRIVDSFTGLSATWSPDGKSIAFLKGSSPYSLIVRSAQSGEERLYSHAGGGNVSPRWFHEGSSLLAHVIESLGTPSVPQTAAFYKIDIKTGRFTRLITQNTPERRRDSMTAIAPDDKTVYMTAADASSPRGLNQVIAVDVETGSERVVFTLPAEGDRFGYGIALSPDGRTLLLNTQGGPDISLFTLDVDGTNHRKVYGPFRSVNCADKCVWSPDGRSVLFEELRAGGTWRVMRVPAAGGVPQPDGLDLATLRRSEPTLSPSNLAYNIDVNPDGSRILFGHQTAVVTELWAIDGVLAGLHTAGR